MINMSGVDLYLRLLTFSFFTAKFIYWTYSEYQAKKEEEIFLKEFGSK